MARKKAVTSTSREILEPRVYEIGFLLSPAIRDEDLAARENEIKDIITSAGGTIITNGAPEFIDLAYEMSRVIDNKRVRFTQGYFGWIKFTLEPSELLAVKDAIEKKAFLIRSLITATVMENTVISKKPLSKILKSNSRESIAEEIITDADLEDIDPGMAAVELQTPVNEVNEDIMVEELPDELVEEVVE